MNKRICASILALLQGALLLASCGTDTTAAAEPEQTTAPTAATEAVETEPARPAVNLPDDLDFGGRTFRQLAFDWQGYKYYFFADAENGDIMNDAIHERTVTTEDTLNVDIVYEILTNNVLDVPNAVKKAVQAGDDAYDQVLFHCIGGIASMASGGYLYNLDEMPYIDIGASWWNQAQMDAIRLGQNTYYAVNDFMLPCPYIIYFNKGMIETFDMENPYQLVYDGKWTLDAFTQMAKSVVADLNGDGKMDWQNDRYGVAMPEVSKLVSFMTGSGQFMTSRNSDGTIYLDFNTPKTQAIIEQFADLAKSDVISIWTNEQTIELTMDSDRLLFHLDTLSDAERMRSYEVEFGFLPYPKYDEAQESYLSLDWGGLMGVPTTITDPECVGAVLELLAYESSNTVIPAYYDTVLTGKLTRDEDAKKMLDIIFDTICYEVGGNYFGFDNGFRELFYVLSELSVKKQSDAFASYYEKSSKQAVKLIDKFYSSLSNTES